MAQNAGLQKAAALNTKYVYYEWKGGRWSPVQPDTQLQKATAVVARAKRTTMTWASTQNALATVRQEQERKNVTVRFTVKREGLGAVANEDWDTPQQLGLEHCDRLTGKGETTRTYWTNTGKWQTRLEVWTVHKGFAGLWKENLRVTPIANKSQASKATPGSRGRGRGNRKENRGRGRRGRGRKSGN